MGATTSSQPEGPYEILVGRETRPKTIDFEIPPDIDKKIEDWEKQSKSLSIFITGKTGTGKSCLVYKIIGKAEPVTEEGSSLKPKTSEVSSWPIPPVEGITVTVWDSPGLQDGTTNEKQYLKEIKEKCEDVDLFIFCIRMSESKFIPGFENNDVSAMKKLTDQLTKQLWKNAIIVLTFANDIEGEADDKYFEYENKEERIKDYFMNVFVSFKTAIRTALLKDIKIPEEIVKEVPIIPAGYTKNTLPYTEAKDFDWLTHLWIQAVWATKSRAQPALIKINEHRFATHAEYISKQKDLVFQQKGLEFGKSLNMNPELSKLCGKLKSEGKTSASLMIELYVHHCHLHGADGRCLAALDFASYRLKSVQEAKPDKKPIS